jgi:hypothetical protein
MVLEIQARSASECVIDVGHTHLRFVLVFGLDLALSNLTLSNLTLSNLTLSNERYVRLKSRSVGDHVRRVTTVDRPDDSGQFELKHQTSASK